MDHLRSCFMLTDHTNLYSPHGNRKTLLLLQLALEDFPSLDMYTYWRISRQTHGTETKKCQDGVSSNKLIYRHFEVVPKGLQQLHAIPLGDYA